ncbi:MAG: hypothetical protein RIB60_04160 [Phycisphaerales bacterium]
MTNSLNVAVAVACLLIAGCSPYRIDAMAQTMDGQPAASRFTVRMEHTVYFMDVWNHYHDTARSGADGHAVLRFKHANFPGTLAVDLWAQDSNYNYSWDRALIPVDELPFESDWITLENSDVRTRHTQRVGDPLPEPDRQMRQIKIRVTED